VRELREKEGTSQRQLADKAAVNRSTLRSIEAGLTTGDIIVIERLLDALGYELEALNRASFIPTSAQKIAG
jgi:transcriptional regulator with XRE-family HTH domain